MMNSEIDEANKKIGNKKHGSKKMDFTTGC